MVSDKMAARGKWFASNARACHCFQAFGDGKKTKSEDGDVREDLLTMYPDTHIVKVMTSRCQRFGCFLLSLRRFLMF